MFARPTLVTYSAWGTGYEYHRHHPVCKFGEVS